MNTVPPWSYSSLETFEICPKQYYHRYILKEKQPDTEVMRHGIAVHKALELRLLENKDLPKEYSDYENYVSSIEAAKGDGQIFVELPLAIDNAFKPCDFFAPDVWGRGKADVVIDKGDRMWVGDWKTGKVREKQFQVQVFAAFLFKMFPRVKEIYANNIWLQAKKVGDGYTFTRARESSIWTEILQKINRIELAFSKDKFDPKPSGLCAFCPVKTCPHNRS